MAPESCILMKQVVLLIVMMMSHLYWKELGNFCIVSKSTFFYIAILITGPGPLYTVGNL